MNEERLLNNRYQLLEERGKGGMAFVYHARDLMLERDVAVKILREDFSDDATFQERFRQEAKAAANLSHPNLVTVHDFGFDQGKLFIVMEYVPGVDLKTLLKQRGRLSPGEALPLMIQACAGIGYAHRAGLVHCDVKPQNLLVMPDNRLKVTDFGIARALATIQPEEQADVVWGSPQYFSPEQAFGAAPSPASDVYSLGIVLYEMLAGRLPFAWIYPTGEKQEERKPKHVDKFHWATVTAGDCHYIKRYMPDDMQGKVIVTNTTTPADVELFRKSGVKYLITTTPVLEGRSFGTNMMESALIAISGKKRPLTDAEYSDLLAQLKFEPQIQELN